MPLPWDAIVKLLLGALAFGLGVAGWRRAGKWKAQAKSAEGERDAVIEAAERHDRARAQKDGPARSDVGGLLDRHDAERRRRVRMRIPDDPI